MSEQITTNVRVGQKVNLGNYESAEVSIQVSGVGPEATDEEIDDALDTSKIVYTKIVERLRQKVAAIRNEF